MSRVLRDNRYLWMSRLAVGVTRYLKNHHCSMAMSAEHRSKFVAQQWSRPLCVKKTEQTNKIFLKLVTKMFGFRLLIITFTSLSFKKSQCSRKTSFKYKFVLWIRWLPCNVVNICSKHFKFTKCSQIHPKVMLNTWNIFR